jgi:hypothetical protein
VNPTGPPPDVGLHGRPTAAELIDAVASFLREDLAVSLDDETAARLAHQIRIAVHALEVVRRELALGPVQAEAHRTRLDALGFADDRSLAHAIRSGELVDSHDLRTALRNDTRDRLAVANPRWLPPEEQVAT